MNVLVTSAEQLIALSVVRSLGKRGIHVACASDKQKALSFYSKYCSRKIVHPPASKEKKFILYLEKLLKKESYDVLFPVWIDSVLSVSRNRDRLVKYTKIPLPAHEKLCIANDKAETLRIAMENGIQCPKTYFVEGMHEVEKLRDELEYPVVVKARESFGAKDLSYVTSGRDLVCEYRKIASNNKNPLIQECIPLEGEAYGFEALFNEDSKPRATFVHKRIRQFPLTGGQSTLRESVENPEIKKLGVKLLKALGWYGVAMVEFKMDPRDNKPKLMEINPRFWGSLPLSIASGVDFPYLLYQMAMEGDIKPVSKYKVGVKCRLLLPADIRYILSVLRDDFSQVGLKKPDKSTALMDFFRFFGRDLYYDLISLDDPKPALAEIRNILFRAYKKK